MPRFTKMSLVEALAVFLVENQIRYAIERKLLEIQLGRSSRLESLGVLAGGVAHEFNNLLTSIMGYTQLGIDGLPPGNPVCEDLQVVLRSAERARKLASQLLTFSRQQPSEIKAFDLNQLILKVGQILRSVIDTGVEIVTRLTPNLNLVSANPEQVEQILMNLAINARDAMPMGGRLVIETNNFTVTQAQAGPWDCLPGKYVSITVNVCGVGMSEDVKRKAFDPFFTTKEIGKGTGLGLSICYGLTKQNGGFIEVDSEVNHGTTVRVLLLSSRQGVGLLTKN